MLSSKTIVVQLLALGRSVIAGSVAVSCLVLPLMFFYELALAGSGRRWNLGLYSAYLLVCHSFVSELWV